MASQLSWAEKYESEFVPAIFEQWAHRTVAIANPQKGEHALDIACGTGIVARTVAPYIGSEGRVVGVDYNLEMLAAARALPIHAGTGIEWVEGNAQQLPFPDMAFDIVLCQGGLQFIADRRAALQEMYRVLKPQGRMALMLFREIHYAPAFALLAEKIASYAPPRMINSIQAPFSLGNTDEVQELVAQAGFARISLQQETREASFLSAEAFVRARLLATSVHDTVENQMLTRAIEEVGAALQPYEVTGKLVFPMTGYRLLAYKQL